MSKPLATAAAALILALLASTALAQATEPPATTPAPPPGMTCVRAQDLASAEEFAAHQARMRSAQTPEQRAQEMATFMQQMRERAKERNQQFCRDVMGGPGMGGGPGGKGRGPGGMGGGPGGGMGPPGTTPPAPPAPPAPN